MPASRLRRCEGGLRMKTPPPDQASLTGRPKPGEPAATLPMGASSRAWTRPRIFPGALALAWVALTALLLWHGHGALVPSAAAQPPDEGGYLLVAGVYLPPPYVVSLDSAGVSVNGYLLQPSARERSGHTVRPIDAAAPGVSA